MRRAAAAHEHGLTMEMFEYVIDKKKRDNSQYVKKILDAIDFIKADISKEVSDYSATVSDIQNAASNLKKFHEDPKYVKPEATTTGDSGGNKSGGSNK